VGETVRDVRARLHAEDDGRFVYRGQTKEYAAPLVPSMFRPMVADGGAFHPPQDAPALRKVHGAQFVETLSPEAVQARLPDERVVDYARRLLIKDRLIELFGYPLAQILAQQAGLWSEGLDVTTSLDVAVFFATHDYDRATDRYRPIADGSGVIYRWPLAQPPRLLSVRDLARLDFYTCPTYLPSTHVLSTFGAADSDATVLMDLIKFMMRRKGARLEPLEEPAKDPFDTLTLTPTALSASRIVRQAAALLIPDQILSRHWSNASFPRIAADRTWSGPMCVEDLALTRDVTAHRFDHDTAHQTDELVDAADTFPRRDACCLLVRECINFCAWAVRYGMGGSISVIGRDVGNLRIVWDDFVFDGISTNFTVEPLML
jgi:hypothetical protein